MRGASFNGTSLGGFAMSGLVLTTAFHPLYFTFQEAVYALQLGILT